jgi:hypothetical protein
MSKIYANILTGCVFVVMGAIFIYGQITFPDAPIKLGLNGNYKGKQGQIRSRVVYEKYTNWILTMQFLWPAGMITIFFLQKKK